MAIPDPALTPAALAAIHGDAGYQQPVTIGNPHAPIRRARILAACVCGRSRRSRGFGSFPAFPCPSSPLLAGYRGNK